MAKNYLTKVEVASATFDRTGFYAGSNDGFKDHGHKPTVSVTIKVIGRMTSEDVGRVVSTIEGRLRDKFEEVEQTPAA